MSYQQCRQTTYQRRISDVKNFSSQFRRGFVEIFEQSATSRRRRRFVKIHRLFFKQSAKSLRRHRFIKIYWSSFNNSATSKMRWNTLVILDQSLATSKIRQNLLVIFRPICDVAATYQTFQDSLIVFRHICDLAATSEIRQNLLVIFRTIFDVEDSLKVSDHFSTNLRRRRFIEIYCLFLNDLLSCSDVTDSSKFIGYF